MPDSFIDRLAAALIFYSHLGRLKYGNGITGEAIVIPKWDTAKKSGLENLTKDACHQKTKKVMQPALGAQGASQPLERNVSKAAIIKLIAALMRIEGQAYLISYAFQLYSWFSMERSRTLSLNA